MTRATKRLRRSSVAGLAALATVGGALVAAAGTAGATSTATVTRIAGTDRYDTAAQLATKAFPNGTTNVIIASGAAAHFPDALSGNYLAGQLNAPILLTSSTGAMPASTTNALTALHPTKVYILGDANAVPTEQETTLTAAGYTVVRLGGTDRYQTNLKVVQAVGSAGTVGGTVTGIVASGANFPDALSAGPLAFASKLPIILTDPTSPSSTVATAISSLGVKQVIIMGSTAAVSDADESAIHTDGASTLVRFAGTDRSNTSQLLANWEIANASFSTSAFVVASGDQTLSGADALSGGPFAGSNRVPLLVTNTIDNAGSVTAFASSEAASATSVTILGTTKSVSAAVEAAITTAVKSVAGAVTSLPQLLSASIAGTVTPSQANGTNPEGTTVKYVFSSNVLSAAAGDFKVYDAADDVTTGTVGSSATTSGNTVSVLFSSINATSGGGATDASKLTLATVVPNAVLDGSGNTNPAGAASIGTSSSSTTAATANTTTAPDLRSVSGFRQANPAVAANSTAVDFTFDQAATTVTPANFNLVTTQGATVACTGPVVGDTTTGGGTIAGGNGSTTITAICPDVDAAGVGNTTTIASGIIARGFVGASAVKGTDTAAVNNAQMSANVGGTSTDADLRSATFVPSGTGANSTSNDEVVYKFDQALGTPAFGGFFVIKSDATTVAGTGIDQTSTDGTQVVVAFPKGTLTNAVAASVNATAGTNVEVASVGVAPVSTSSTSVTPGTINAVQLKGVKVVKTTDVLGNATYTAQYTFTAAVAIGAGNFNLYAADGTEYQLAAGGCAVDSSTNTQVDCPGASFSNLPSSGGISGAVLGTVDNGVVTGNTGASSNAAPSTNPNPEGAANVG